MSCELFIKAPVDTIHKLELKQILSNDSNLKTVELIFKHALHYSFRTKIYLDQNKQSEFTQKIVSYAGCTIKTPVDTTRKLYLKQIL